MHSLGLIDPVSVEINQMIIIFFAACSRPNQGDTKLEPILGPLADELIEKCSTFPLTLIYGNLATIAECLYTLATDWVLFSMSQLELHLLPKIGCLLNFMPSIQIMSGKGLFCS